MPRSWRRKAVTRSCGILLDISGVRSVRAVSVIVAFTELANSRAVPDPWTTIQSRHSFVTRQHSPLGVAGLVQKLHPPGTDPVLAFSPMPFNIGSGGRGLSPGRRGEPCRRAAIT